MSAMTESEIIDQVYSLYENDNTTWSSSSAEYLTSRRYSKAAINRWEYLEGANWRELWVPLSSASDGTKTTTSGTYTYSCPTNMRKPPEVGDYVRLVDSSGNSSYLQVVSHQKVSQLDNSGNMFCYFTGNPKDGFTLKINPKLTLVTGNTIGYEYYKNATYLTSTTSTTEISNPFFIVHYILARLYKNDGLGNESAQEMQTAEQLLEEMKSENTEVTEDEESSDSTGFGV